MSNCTQTGVEHRRISWTGSKVKAITIQKTLSRRLANARKQVDKPKLFWKQVFGQMKQNSNFLAITMLVFGKRRLLLQIAKVEAS